MNIQQSHTVALVCIDVSTVGSRFMTVHSYNPCPVGPSGPKLWCITVATQVSFLYLLRF